MVSATGDEINQRVMQRIAAIAMLPNPIDFITKNPDCLFTKYKEIMDAYPGNLNENLFNALWTNQKWLTPQYTCFITDQYNCTKKGFWIAWNDPVNEHDDDQITTSVDANNKLLQLRKDILSLFFTPENVEKICKLIPMLYEFNEKKV
jgi:hypothetical protein